MNVNQDHYALEKLKLSQNMLITAANDMPKLRLSLEKLLKKDKEKAKMCFLTMQNLKTKVLKALTDARLSLLEMQEEQKADKTQRLEDAIMQFNLLTLSYDKFSNVLKEYAESLCFNQGTSAKIIGRLMNNVKLGHYPTDLAHVDMLANSLIFPKENSVNIIDPCCGTGAALHKFCHFGKCATYGVELDEARAEQAVEVLNRVAFGNFFYSRISKKAYHLLFLNPPYLSLIGEAGRTRAEKRFLVESIDLLLLGGVLMFIIPFYRLSDDIARVLCDNFNELQIFRFEKSEFEKWRQIVIIGKRIPRTDGFVHVAEVMNKMDKLEEIPFLSELKSESYALPDVNTNVPMFKGAVFNEKELEQQLSSSHSLKALYTESELDKIIKNPMLPLNLEQIGLVGGSGLINGYADCEHPHVIKGRIVKETLINTRVLLRSITGEPLETEQTETYVNKLIFNILTPKGFKSLN